MKVKTVYLESGEILEFGASSTRAYRARIIRSCQELGSWRKGWVRPRVRFSHPWERHEVRKELVWW